MKKTKKKIRILQIIRWFLLLAPITGVMVYNAKDYFTVEKGFVFKQSIEIGLGTIIALISGVLLGIGKSNFFKGSKGFWVATLLAVLLKVIINDLILIFFAVSSGATLFESFKPKIDELKEIYKEERQAGIHAKAISNVMYERENIKTNKERLGNV